MAITGVTAGNNDLSIAMWYKPTSQPANNTKHSIFWLGTGTATRDAIGLAYFNDGGTYKLTFLAEGDNKSEDQTLNNATWYHLAATYNATTNVVTFYVNGSSIGTETLAGDLAISATGLQIMVGNDIDGNEAIGEIDDVRYVEEELSSSAASWLYNSGAGRTASLSTHFVTKSLEGTTKGRVVEIKSLAGTTKSKITARVTGNVKLGTNNVENARIRVIRQSDNVGIATTTTDSSGNYAFDDLVESVEYHITVEYESGGNKYNSKSYPFVIGG